MKEEQIQIKNGLPISILKEDAAKFCIGDKVLIPSYLLQNDNLIAEEEYEEAVIHSICTHHIVYKLKKGNCISLDKFDSMHVVIKEKSNFKSYSEAQALQDVANSIKTGCHK